LKDKLANLNLYVNDNNLIFNFKCSNCVFNYSSLSEEDLPTFLRIRNSSASFLHDSRIFDLHQAKIWFKSNNNDSYVIVNYEKNIIGYLRFRRNKINQIWIGLDIDEKLRGRGLGKKIYRCIFLHTDVLNNEGEVMLEVLETNARAIKLYQKIGFLENERKKIIRDDIKIESIQMKLDKSRYFN